MQSSGSLLGEPPVHETDGQSTKPKVTGSSPVGRASELRWETGWIREIAGERGSAPLAIGRQPVGGHRLGGQVAAGVAHHGVDELLALERQ